VTVIEYMPSPDIHEYLRYEEGRRYGARYHYSLGSHRKRIHIADGDVKFQFDKGGGLGAVPILVELGAGSLEYMEWLEVEKLQPPGWLGDLEPGSPPFAMERRGPRVDLPEGFRYEPPPFLATFVPPREPGARFSLRVEDHGESGLYVTLSGSASSFVMLAKHVIYLAQDDVPPNSRIDYFEPIFRGDSGTKLTLERAEFPKNVPWAKSPGRD